MVNVWIHAARPKTLMASAAPVAIGVALAYRDGVFYAPAALAALLGALAIQIGTNYYNDYCDYVLGADTAWRKGPTRAVQAGLVSPEAMRRATVLAFLVAGLCCAYLVWRAGWPLLILGIISIACGVAYTAGRYSLAYLGLGDLFVLIFFGPVAVGGTYYVQALNLPWPVLLAGLAPGLLAVGLLVVNNLRDIDEDRQANKRTLAVRFGPTFARLEYTACVLLAAAVPSLLSSVGFLSREMAAVITLTLLPGLFVIRRVWEADGTELNPILGKTAAVLLGYTAAFCMVCVISW